MNFINWFLIIKQILYLWPKFHFFRMYYFFIDGLNFLIFLSVSVLIRYCYTIFCLHAIVYGINTWQGLVPQNELQNDSVQLSHQS